ncbi:MAG: hypothetical protein HW390_1230 [Candidatus Brocadiaceae bacterium]|nr:hypothetical protein [Candidatus Brocadiaceae bacterium]
MDAAKLVTAWIIPVFIGLLGLLVLYKIYTDKIKLEGLINESNSDGSAGLASMSRFQFLIFTFVIAMSLVVITIATGKFPEIPNGVWALLGISGGSYVVSKGIQSKSEEEENRIKANEPPK